MTKFQHKIYISLFVAVTLLSFGLIVYYGYSYYSLPLEERFFSPLHNNFKPSGFIGHGLGIIGSLMMFLGVVIYMIRKRVKSLYRFGILKYWLELHIFLCTLGPILVLFHTAFKFGGIVSVSFWSMVAVFLSGVVGRFIYVRIPRTIQGVELNLKDVDEINDDFSLTLRNKYKVDEKILLQIENFSNKKYKRSLSFRNIIYFIMKDYFNRKSNLRYVKKALLKSGVSKKNINEIKKISKQKLLLSNRIGYLRIFQNLFKYWHIVHLPFALIMLLIMLIHIGVTVTFGYKWIF